VTNGANSVISGAGSVGGNINLITKRPKGDDSAVLSAGIGTDNYYRGTVDVNRRVNDLIAFRLNAMAHRNDVPGRDVEDYKRWGIAPAVTIGIDSPTRLTLQYYHQEDTNIPQYGVPYYASAGGKPAGISRSGYYGLRGVDKQKINVDQFTATFEHEFSDKVSIRNLARWQDVRQLSIATAPQGTFCLASGVTPTGGACTTSASAISPVTATSFGGPATVAITVPAGSYLLTGPQGNVRDTRNQLMFDQIDLKAVFDTAGIEHTLDVGAAASWEKFELSGASALRNADGTNPYDRTTTARHLPFGSIADPNSANLYTGPINITPTSYQRGEQTNYAVYALDTLKLGRYLELSLRRALRSRIGQQPHRCDRRLQRLWPVRHRQRPDRHLQQGRSPDRRDAAQQCRPVLLSPRPHLQAGGSGQPLCRLRQLAHAIESLGQWLLLDGDLQHLARIRQELRDRRQGRTVRRRLAGLRRGVPQRTRSLRRRLERSDRARSAA
jgi:catecholate siderophore receptor